MVKCITYYGKTAREEIWARKEPELRKIFEMMKKESVVEESDYDDFLKKTKQHYINLPSYDKRNESNVDYTIIDDEELCINSQRIFLNDKLILEYKDKEPVELIVSELPILTQDFHAIIPNVGEWFLFDENLINIKHEYNEP